MPTPSKPVTVLKREKKSHRTKQELAQREKAENALASGKEFKERKEVKENPVAHKEFLRLKALLKGIKKNDALYEPIINRYCLIQAEVLELEQRRLFLSKLVREQQKEHEAISVQWDEVIKQIDDARGKAEILEKRTRELSRCAKDILCISSEEDEIDKLIQRKRAMLFNIEKENIMTIASALRTIPKNVTEKKKTPLLEALAD